MRIIGILNRFKVILISKKMSWIQNHLNYIPQIKQYIPLILHIIWVGKASQPETLSVYISKWKELMPHWTVRLWTNDDLNAIEFEDEVLARINEAEKGVQKADIMRYAIVEKYGGIYMDADVEPTRCLDPLVYISDLVICHHNEVTWRYIAVGFFAASPHHPVMKHALKVCMITNLNTDCPNMTTGPGALGIAIATTPPSNEKYTLLPIDCIYWPEGGLTPNRFGRHLFAKNWYE